MSGFITGSGYLTVSVMPCLIQSLDYELVTAAALERVWPYTGDLLMVRYREFLSRFGEYLRHTGAACSQENAAEWLESNFRGPAYMVGHRALSVIGSTLWNSSSLPYRSGMSAAWRSETRWVAETIKEAGELSYGAGFGLKRFLMIADYLGAREAGDIDHFMIAGIYDCRGPHNIAGIGRWLEKQDAARGTRHLAHVWDYHYRIALLKADAPGEAARSLNSRGNFYRAVEEALAGFRKPGCAHSLCRYLKSFEIRLGLFMEANGIGYSRETALARMDASHLSKTATGDIIYPITLVMKMLDTGRDFYSVYYDRNSPRRKTETIAPWIDPYFELYRKFRVQNGMTSSTLSMDFNSITGFSIILNGMGCKSVSDITPELIRRFHLEDTAHKTPRGENAYNARIRGFLKFPEPEGMITEPLSAALPTTSAPGTRPVEVPGDGEIKVIIAWPDAGDDGTLHYYRDSALISIMLFCGLRISDARFLRFDELDLKTMSITKIQQKTGCHISVPVFNRVVNAIFRYISKERPDIDSPFIFVSNSPSRSGRVCGRSSLNKILFHLTGRRCGSHILRRTFASSLVRSAATDPVLVAMAPGHSGLANLSKYLDTDNDRMAEVPLMLDGLEYTGRMI